MPDHPDGNPTPLTHFARRAESDPLFLAAQLALYRDSRGWTDDDLAAYLGVPVESLTRLALCRRCETPAHVREVAAEFGCDAGRLAAACGIPADAP